MSTAESTILCNDPAIVKRKSGLIFSAVKEKAKQLELHMVSGQQYITIKVFSIVSKVKEGKVKETMVVVITGESILRTALPDEPELSFSINTSRDDDAPIFIFEDADAFSMWRITLEACIKCLRTNVHITDDLYLQHLDEAEVEADKREKEKKLASLQQVEKIRRTPDPGSPRAQSPPKPAKPVKNISKFVEGGAGSAVSVDFDPQNVPRSAVLPSRPQLANTPVKGQAGTEINLPSSKPLASAGRPWLGHSARISAQGPNVPAMSAFPTTPVSARVGRPTQILIEESDEGRRLQPFDGAPVSGEVDQVSVDISAPPPSTPVIRGLTPTSPSSTQPPTPPARRGDATLETYNALNSSALGLGTGAARTMDLGAAGGPRLPVHKTHFGAPGHSDFIYTREIQALAQINEQLSAAAHQAEEQRIADQDKFMARVAELQELHEATRLMLEVLAGEKAELAEELQRTCEALVAMAHMKDQFEMESRDASVEAVQLKGHIADMEARAEQGEDSLAIIALRESLRTAKERASSLEVEVDKKITELAKTSTAMNRSQQELRAAKQELDEKSSNYTSLKSTVDALLQQISTMKEESFALQAARIDEQARAARDLERAKAALETDKSERLVETEEIRSSERKHKKTISMYEALTADQQVKINALSEACDGYLEAKKELATYVANADALAKATLVSQEVSARLERELSLAFQRMGQMDSERAAILAEVQENDTRRAEELESLHTAKRHAVAQQQQLLSDKQLLQLKIDGLTDKCSVLEKELETEQLSRCSDVQAGLRRQQQMQEQFDAHSRAQRDVIAKAQLTEQTLQGTIDKLKRSVQGLEESLAEKTQQHATAASRLAGVESEVQLLQGREVDLQRAVKAVERKLVHSKENAEERERVLGNQAALLEKQLEATSAELEQALRNKEDLAITHRQSETDKKARETELYEAKRDNEDLRGRFVALALMQQAAEEKLHATTTELDVLRRVHENLQTTKTSLDSTLRERHAEITELTVALSSARAKEATIETLSAQLKAVEQQIAAKSNECAVDARMITHLQDTIHEMELAAAAAPIEISSLKAQIASQRERLQQSADQMGVLKTSLACIERERDELSGHCSEQRIGMSELKNANTMLQMQIDSLRREIASHKAQHDRYEINANVSDADRATLLEQLRQSESNLSDCRESISKITDKFEFSEHNLRLANQYCEDHLRTIETLERGKESLAASLEQAQSRMRSMITTDEACARSERQTGLWSAEREALLQKMQTLSLRLDNECTASDRGREKLSTVLRSFVISPGTLPIAFSADLLSSADRDGADDACNPFQASEAHNPFVHLQGSSESSGDVYADILRVVGAGETIRAAVLELLNSILTQYSLSLSNRGLEREKLRSHLDRAASVPLELLLKETLMLFDNYRRQEREAAAVLVQTSRDECEARKFADEQASESRKELRQCETRLEAMRSQKDMAERRAASEISTLQTELESVRREWAQHHEDHQKTVANLSLAHEDRGRRLEETVRIELQEQLAAQASSHAATISEYTSLVASLRHTEDMGRRDRAALEERILVLTREMDLLKSADRSATVRLSSLEAEVGEKSRSLEAVLAQLERAELKAAKEARRRMDAERMMKRLDSSFDQLVLGKVEDISVAPSPPVPAAALAAAARPVRVPVNPWLQQQSNSVYRSLPLPDAPPDRAGRGVEHASQSVQDRIKAKGWHTPAK